jgi:hypothetical protein
MRQSDSSSLKKSQTRGPFASLRMTTLKARTTAARLIALRVVVFVTVGDFGQGG